MALPELLGHAVRAPLLLGTRSVHGLAGGIQKAGKSGSAARTVDTYRELGDTVAKQLGRAGLAGRPTPPSYGLVAGIRFRQPPGSLSRGARAAGRALSEKAGDWGAGLENLRGSLGALAEKKAAQTGRRGDVVEKKLTMQSKIASPGDVVEQKVVVERKLARTGEKPVPAMDGKGGDRTASPASVEGRVRTVGAMFERIQSIVTTVQQEILRSAGPLRV